MRIRNDPDITRVSGKLVARCFGRTGTMIRKWVKAGILPQPTKPASDYNLIECVQAYVDWVKRRKEMTGEFDAKRQVLVEKHKALKMENDRRGGKVVDIEEVEDVYLRTIATIAMRLEAIPGRMAAELSSISDPAIIRQRLRHEVSDIRTSAESGLKAFVDGAKGSGPNQVPTSASARRVGRSKPRVTSRLARARSIQKR